MCELPRSPKYEVWAVDFFCGRISLRKGSHFTGKIANYTSGGLLEHCLSHSILNSPFLCPQTVLPRVDTSRLREITVTTGATTR